MKQQSPKLNLPRTSTNLADVLEASLRWLPLKLRPTNEEDWQEFRVWLRGTLRSLMEASLTNCRAASEMAMQEITALMMNPNIYEDRRKRRAERKEQRRIRRVFDSGPGLLERRPKTRTIQ